MVKPKEEVKAGPSPLLPDSRARSCFLVQFREGKLLLAAFVPPSTSTTETTERAAGVFSSFLLKRVVLGSAVQEVLAPFKVRSDRLQSAEKDKGRKGSHPATTGSVDLGQKDLLSRLESFLASSFSSPVR